MTNTVTVQQLNQNVVLVKPEFHITTGRKKLLEEDLRLPDGSMLPPDALVSLGSKKVIDPSEIKEFTKLRDQANTACEKVGIKFLGGYAVPNEEADALALKLDSIIDEFAKKRIAFLDSYDQIVDRWCFENPDWSTLIRQAVPQKSVVAARLSADYVVFQVTPVDGRVPHRLENKVKGLGGQLFAEIANDARRFVEESIYERQTKDQKASNSAKQLRKDGVTQKALRPIVSIRAKMESLRFLDGRIHPVLNHIDGVLAKMPDKGRIVDQHYNELLQLSLILSDEEKMMQLSDVLSFGQTHSPHSDEMFAPATQSLIDDFSDSGEMPQSNMANKPITQSLIDDFNDFGEMPQSNMANKPITQSLIDDFNDFGEMPQSNMVDQPANNEEAFNQTDKEGLEDHFADLRAALQVPDALQPQQTESHDSTEELQQSGSPEPTVDAESRVKPNNTIEPVPQPVVTQANDWF